MVKGKSGFAFLAQPFVPVLSLVVGPLLIATGKEKGYKGEKALCWTPHAKQHMDTVISKNGIALRLTAERWSHITEEHCELAGMKLEVLETIARPSQILLGNAADLLAIRELEPGKYMVVVYREFKNDGFIITAFLTRRIRALERRKQQWP